MSVEQNNFEFFCNFFDEFKYNACFQLLSEILVRRLSLDEENTWLNENQTLLKKFVMMQGSHK